jgi:acyl carrier protein
MIYKDLIAKSFNEAKNKIQKNILVSKYNWDSMTKINLITNIDNKFKKTIDYKKFDKIKTFEDLDKLIQKTLK